jgi:hypothetical protein
MKDFEDVKKSVGEISFSWCLGEKNGNEIK